MTATTHVTLWCDNPDCQCWIDFGERSFYLTRQRAKETGWVFTRNADYCCKEHAPSRSHDD
jgi:hypothetical protein